MLLDGEDVNRPGTGVVLLRAPGGHGLSEANPFPRTIFENMAGLRVNGLRDESLIAEKVEISLRRVVIFDVVKDRLQSSALLLSGGQQQRLRIATQKIEEGIRELRASLTIIVTHDMQQAARVSEDFTAFFTWAALGTTPQT